MPQVEVPDGYLSEESSFYGDEDEVVDMDYREAIFDPRSYWSSSRLSSFSAIAVSQQTSSFDQTSGSKGNNILDKKASSRHPYDGNEACRQPTETVEQFLHRLPPSRTRTSDISSPWIRIANREADSNHLTPEQRDNLTSEGDELLDAFETVLSTLQSEQQQKGQTKAAVTRKVNTERRKLEADLLKIARDSNVISGKWMLFPSSENVDDTWAAVAGATAKGKLGIAAKVATDTGTPSGRLIAVYTRDFGDKEDIRRVLVKLIDMGVVKKSQAIYYKCDAYTYLDIKSGNVWGLKPSMYSSTEALARKW